MEGNSQEEQEGIRHEGNAEGEGDREEVGAQCDEREEPALPYQE